MAAKLRLPQVSGPPGAPRGGPHWTAVVHPTAIPRAAALRRRLWKDGPWFSEAGFAHRPSFSCAPQRDTRPPVWDRLCVAAGMPHPEPIHGGCWPVCGGRKKAAPRAGVTGELAGRMSSEAQETTATEFSSHRPSSSAAFPELMLGTLHSMNGKGDSMGQTEQDGHGDRAVLGGTAEHHPQLRSHGGVASPGPQWAAVKRPSSTETAALMTWIC